MNERERERELSFAKVEKVVKIYVTKFDCECFRKNDFPSLPFFGDY